MLNQKGIVHLFLLVVIAGVLTFLVISSNAPLREGIFNILYPKPKSEAANPWDGVPDLPIDYNLSTEQWWANNPFNPDSPNSNTQINSPDPRIDVQAAHGGDIVAAYNALPATGGTLYLKPGNYNFGSLLVATKDNVHFLGETGATIRGTIRVICGTGPNNDWLDYGKFNLAVHQNQPGARECFTSRASNYYFKNIIFDGQGQPNELFYASAAKNVVFDGVTVRNFTTPCDTDPSCFPHGGNIECNAGCSNLWILNSRFEGREQFAVYFDGCHNCGIVNSTFNDNYRAGIGVFLTNDDFSYDLNNNNQFDPAETRNANYIAFYKNNVDSVYTVVANSGKSMMFARNTIGGSVIPYRNTARCSQKYLPLPLYPKYTNTYDVVRDNVLGTGFSGNYGFMRIEETSHNVGCPVGDRLGTVGKYIVVNNTVNSAPGGYQFIEHEGNVEGPNVICGNMVNGSLSPQNTSTNCPTPPAGNGTPPPTPTPTQTPTPIPSPTVTPIPYQTPSGGISNVDYFPIGIFEDGNITSGNSADFTDMVNNLKSKGFDSVMFTNNSANRDEAMLSVSDNLTMNVFFAPYYEMHRNWYTTDVNPNPPAATIENARTAIYPLIDKVKNHPSVKGYLLYDEPGGTDDQNRIALAKQVVEERDPTRFSTPVLIGLNRAEPILDATKPEVMLIDVYPMGGANPACDYSMSGFGYTPATFGQFGFSDDDMVAYIRAVTRTKDPNIPLWVILQTHNWGDPGVDNGFYSLRKPSAAEVRAQNWMAIGEGATGIFWFIYTSQQGWTGLKDETNLMNEVSTLANRLNPLRGTLLGLKRNSTDQFSVSGPNNPYISTLVSADGSQKYAVAVNRESCSSNQNLTINSSLSGSLKDLETGQIYAQGASINFLPGDGKIFELVSGGKRGDLNGDGKIGVIDFSILLSKWNSSDTQADLNQDGKVGILDFSVLLSNWG